MSAGGGSDGAAAGHGGPLRELRHAFGPAGHAEAVEVVTLEAAAAAYGLYTWPSAPVLAHWVWAHRHRLRGAAVLELGAGTSLAGLVAAAVGARVTLTDRADAQQVLDNAAAAVARNGLGARCGVMPLTWGAFTPQLVALPPQDVVLGADVLYDSAEFEPLLATVAFLLRRAAPTARFVTAYQQRSRHASLEWRLEHWGLECVSVTPAEEVLPAAAAAELRQVVHVVELALIR